MASASLATSPAAETRRPSLGEVVSEKRRLVPASLGLARPELFMLLSKARLSSGEICVGVIQEDEFSLLDLNQVESVQRLSDILHHADPRGLAKFLIDTQQAPLPLSEIRLLAPVDRQEIWAAGVTYKRSQVARMEESERGASHYDLVYSADRPELFFKSLPERVVHPGEPVRVRADSQWTVPEPELALVISPDKHVVGFTIGNDMSARDIEGENPLYLPQAKVYNQCCAMGPAILLADQPVDRDRMTIKLRIQRKKATYFEGETTAGNMARTFDELARWLTREYDIPQGAILLTGTGIVPPDDLSLAAGDGVEITIDGIGTLTNPVVKGTES